MEALSIMGSAVLLAFVAAAALIVFFKLVSGRISLRGLLTDKASGGPSYVRAQLLVVTVSSAATYLALAISSSPNESLSLPPPPLEMMLVLGGSNAVYAGGTIVGAIWAAVGPRLLRK